MKLNNLTGVKFGMLKVVSRAESRKGATYWNCQCDCGSISIVAASNLARNNAKSCGCNRSESLVKHGLTRKGAGQPPEYQVWSQMIQRCTNPKNKSYKYYGGRGIMVCKRWLNSFENFIADMGMRDSQKHSIERSKNNLGYNPKNCRWATQLEQARNTRRVRLLSFNGEKLSMMNWAEIIGIKYGTLRSRIQRGMKIKEALKS